MSRIVKAGIIQMANKLVTGASVQQQREAMLEAHLPYIDEAGRQGVQMLCFQEIFTGPYFCPSQDARQKSIQYSAQGGESTYARGLVNETA